MRHELGGQARLQRPARAAQHRAYFGFFGARSDSQGGGGKRVVVVSQLGKRDGTRQGRRGRRVRRGRRRGCAAHRRRRGACCCRRSARGGRATRSPSRGCAPRPPKRRPTSPRSFSTASSCERVILVAWCRAEGCSASFPRRRRAREKRCESASPPARHRNGRGALLRVPQPAS